MMLKQKSAEGREPFVYVFVGPEGAGKHEIIRELCAQTGMQHAMLYSSVDPVVLRDRGTHARYIPQNTLTSKVESGSMYSLGSTPEGECAIQLDNLSRTSAIVADERGAQRMQLAAQLYPELQVRTIRVDCPIGACRKRLEKRNASPAHIKRALSRDTGRYDDIPYDFRVEGNKKHADIVKAIARYMENPVRSKLTIAAEARLNAARETDVITAALMPDAPGQPNTPNELGVNVHSLQHAITEGTGVRRISLNSQEEAKEEPTPLQIENEPDFVMDLNAMMSNGAIDNYAPETPEYFEDGWMPTEAAELPFDFEPVGYDDYGPDLYEDLVPVDEEQYDIPNDDPELSYESPLPQQQIDFIPEAGLVEKQAAPALQPIQSAQPGELRNPFQALLDAGIGKSASWPDGRLQAPEYFNAPHNAALMLEKPENVRRLVDITANNPTLSYDSKLLLLVQMEPGEEKMPVRTADEWLAEGRAVPEGTKALLCRDVSGSESPIAVFTEAQTAPVPGREQKKTPPPHPSALVYALTGDPGIKLAKAPDVARRCITERVTDLTHKHCDGSILTDREVKQIAAAAAQICGERAGINMGTRPASTQLEGVHPNRVTPVVLALSRVVCSMHNEIDTRLRLGPLVQKKSRGSRLSSLLGKDSKPARAINNMLASAKKTFFER